ncbi:MAG: polyprenyl diphosphate synthase [Planctomycetota bacterium]
MRFEGREYVLPGRIPRHVALIMDGNGRWARARGLPRIRGHEAGAEALRRVTRFSRTAGVRELTVFALSTENFRKRPRGEIRVLMRLLRSYLVSERKELLENGIRLRAAGRLEELPAGVRAALEETVGLTAECRGMVLRLALNYGGRQEILDALAKLSEDVRSGRAAPPSLEEGDLRKYLYDPEMSDPDLLIRTAGELRLSNFLLWQCAYTEIWVTERLWPDFGAEDVVEGFASYASRVRKFGALADGENGAAGAGLEETEGGRTA